MRPVLFAALGAIIGAVIGAAIGFYVSAAVYHAPDGCIEGVCGVFGALIGMAGLFGGAIVGALLAIRLSRPGAPPPPDA